MSKEHIAILKRVKAGYKGVPRDDLCKAVDAGIAAMIKLDSADACPNAHVNHIWQWLKIRREEHSGGPVIVHKRCVHCGLEKESEEVL